MGLLRWINTYYLPPCGFKCGYCGHLVSSTEGIGALPPDLDKGISDPRLIPLDSYMARAYACPHCQRVSYWFLNAIVSPLPLAGEAVAGLSGETDAAYTEARSCVRAGAHTACVLMCRKLIMHVAVDKGADPGKSFAFYIDWLDQRHYITPDGKPWVSYIKNRGNEATHEIPAFGKEEAEHVLYFTGSLLKIVYEMASRMPPPGP